MSILVLSAYSPSCVEKQTFVYMWDVIQSLSYKCKTDRGKKPCCALYYCESGPWQTPFDADKISQLLCKWCQARWSFHALALIPGLRLRLLLQVCTYGLPPGHLGLTYLHYVTSRMKPVDRSEGICWQQGAAEPRLSRSQRHTVNVELWKNPEMKNSPFVFCIMFLDQDLKGTNKEI